MINIYEVHETNQMIEQENLDVRTITMGISLLDCAAGNIDELCSNIYNKICLTAIRPIMFPSKRNLPTVAERSWTAAALR